MIQHGRILAIIDGDRELPAQAQARVFANTTDVNLPPFDALSAMA